MTSRDLWQLFSKNVRRQDRNCLSLELLEDRILLAIQIGRNFTGSTFVESNSFPPDTDGAVGPSHFVELINGRYRVYDKSTDAAVQTKTLDKFWTDAGAAPTDSSFDPRVVYDHASLRWFAVSVDNALAANNFLIAVSSTSDPTGTWTGFKIDSDADNGQWADFPTLGVDASAVYVAANMFNIGGGFHSVTILSIPKADLIAATPTIANRTIFENENASTRGFTLQPSVDFGSSDSGGACSGVRGALLASDSSDFIHFNRSSVCGAGASAATLSTATDITIPTYQRAPTADQPSGASDLDTGDTRLSASVYEQGNSLWAVHSISVAGRAALRWYEISETSNNVIQFGTINDPGADLYYPSIAANADGEVVMGFSRSNTDATSGFVSSYYVAGGTVNGVTTFSAPFLLKQGTATYVLVDTASRNRWGDYSATNRDPSDSHTFWTIQEWVSASNTWATQITQLTFPSASGAVTVSGTAAADTLTVYAEGTDRLKYVLNNDVPILVTGCTGFAFNGDADDTLIVNVPSGVVLGSTCEISNPKGQLRKMGTGSFYLRGSNGYDGATTIHDGSILVSVNGAVGTATVGSTVGEASTGPTNYSTGNISTAIVDTSTVEIPLVVADSGTITDVNVKIRLNHTGDGDLDMFLVHPNGRSVELSTGNGGVGDDFGSGSNDCSGTFTVFDDAAATAITAGTAPFAGSFRPEEMLSTLNGNRADGIWKLLITDTRPGDIGTMGCFQLVISRQITSRLVLERAVNYSTPESITINGSGFPSSSPVTYSTGNISTAIGDAILASSGDINTLIVDNGTIEVSLAVPDDGTISDVDVKIRLNHTFDTDLDIFLVHPDGTTVELSTDNGGDGQNYGSGSNNCSGTFTVFDDAAATSITAGTAPFNGAFSPEGMLSALNGKSPKGTWKLRVIDDEPPDGGTVFCVQLAITRLTEIPLVVSDTATIIDVDVKVRLNHTFDADLDMFLVHPDGTTIELSTDNGSSGDDYGSGSNNCSGTFAVFDDAAATAITTGTAPFAGTFRPEGMLSPLNGKFVNGTWKLRVNDDSPTETGIMGCFELIITVTSGLGALVGVGNSTFAGPITLGSASIIAAYPAGFAFTLNGNINTNGQALTVKGSGNTTVGGIVSGSGGVTKDGTGAVTLSNTNTYTGPTTVTAGTLSVTGSLSISSAVAVNSGAVLAGTGTVGAVTATSGTVSPGVGIGDLTGSSANFNPGGILRIQLKGTAGTDFDRLKLSGTLTVGGSSKLTLDLAGLTSTGTAIGIASYGSRAGTPDPTFTTVERINNLSGFFVCLSYGGTSLDVTIQTGVCPQWVSEEADVEPIVVPDIVPAPTRAWAATSRSVTIASLDSGIDYTHPALSQNIWINQAEIPSDVRVRLRDRDGDGRITLRDLNLKINQRPGRVSDSNGNGVIDGGDLLHAWSDGLDDDANGYVDDIIGWDFVNNDNDPMDDSGHGTHGAGILAQVAPRAEVVPLKFLDSNAVGSLSDARRALDYALAKGVPVSSNGWSASVFSQEWLDELKKAESAGHVFVTAAGNGDPALLAILRRLHLSNVVVVTATDAQGRLAVFSNWDPEIVDLAVPGVGVVSAVAGGGYAAHSGTSTSTALVAGLVGLLRTGRPNVSRPELIDAILSSLTRASAATASRKDEPHPIDPSAFTADLYLWRSNWDSIARRSNDDSGTSGVQLQTAGFRLLRGKLAKEKSDR